MGRIIAEWGARSGEGVGGGRALGRAGWARCGESAGWIRPGPWWHTEKFTRIFSNGRIIRRSKLCLTTSKKTSLESCIWSKLYIRIDWHQLLGWIFVVRLAFVMIDLIGMRRLPAQLPEILQEVTDRTRLLRWWILFCFNWYRGERSLRLELMRVLQTGSRRGSFTIPRKCAKKFESSNSTSISCRIQNISSYSVSVLQFDLSFSTARYSQQENSTSCWIDSRCSKSYTTG